MYIFFNLYIFKLTINTIVVPKIISRERHGDINKMLTNITNINKKFIRMSERMILGLFVTKFNLGSQLLYTPMGHLSSGKVTV